MLESLGGTRIASAGNEEAQAMSGTNMLHAVDSDGPSFGH
jgi:hypothetical protein